MVRGRAAGGRGCFPALAGAFRDAGRFGHIEAATRCEGGGFQAIPALELVDGNAKAVGDGDECVSLAGPVHGATG